MASLAIHISAKSDLIAPAGVLFEAIEIAGFDVPGGPGPGEFYDPAFHEITYVWDFGDPGAAFAAPLNIPSVWKNPNTAYGREVAHVFRTPGTYTVSCWAADRSGNTGLASFEITIADPDTVFPGGQTICFDPSGAFAGAPAGAGTHTSWAGALAAYGNLGAAGQKGRILIARGSDIAQWNVNIGIDSDFWFKGLSFRIGAFGTGPRPILRSADRSSFIQNPGGAFSPAWSDMILHDLDFRGEWDAATETGYPTGLGNIAGSTRSRHFFGLFGCRMSGLSGVSLPQCQDTTTVTPDAAALVWDCEITSYRNNGIYQPSMEIEDWAVALVGCSVHQHPDALGGQKDSSQTDSLHNYLHVRISIAKRTIIDACDFFTRHGWTQAGVPDHSADQGVRINTTRADFPTEVSIHRSAIEGGYSCLSFTTSSGVGTASVAPSNIVIDKNLMLATPKTVAFIEAEQAITARNNIMYMPNVDALTRGMEYAITYNTLLSGNPDAMAMPIAIYANTVVMLQTTAQQELWATSAKSWRGMLEGMEIFTTYTVENNVEHVPNVNAPVVADQPVNTDAAAFAVAGVAGRYTGPAYNFDEVQGTLGASVAVGGTVTLPYPAGTSQAYFTAFPANGSHAIVVGSGTYRTADGGIAVAYTAGGFLVTNTSGSTWSSGAAYAFLPDRSAYLPANDAVYDVSGPIPMPYPQTGSNAIGGGGLGMMPLDDFTGAWRPGSAHPGAPQGTPSRGALEPLT